MVLLRFICKKLYSVKGKEMLSKYMLRNQPRCFQVLMVWDGINI